MRQTKNWIPTACGLTAIVLAFIVDFQIKPILDISIYIAYFLTISAFIYVGLASSIKLNHGRIAIFVGVLSALFTIIPPHTVVAPILLVVWVAVLPMYFNRKNSWLSLLLINFMFFIIIALTRENIGNAINALSFVGFQVFAMYSSLGRIASEQQNQELELTHMQLKMTQNLLQEQSKYAERLRIARDIHDGIGQKLTGLILNLEYSRYKQPENLSEYLIQLKNNTSEILNDLRQTVSQMRVTDTINVNESLEALIDSINGITLIKHYEIKLNSSELSGQVLFCLQEGISNALRHGKATHLNLDVVFTKEFAEIKLSDDGKIIVKRNKNNSFGNGIIGMNERLKKFDGKANLTKNLGQGYTLTLRLPLKEFAQNYD